jgi:WD40 repeat protein/mono/diheme cytochrome c family protein
MKRLPVLLLAASMRAFAADAPPDFAEVYRLLDERCIECHTADDPEANLVLETYEGLLKGGETGKAVEPGKSAESLLIKLVRGEVEKEGKKKFMPPGKREKLGPEEIQLIARWIDAGAKPSTGVVKKTLDLPKIAPKVPVRASINALAFSPQAKVVAVGRYQSVELIDPTTRVMTRKLEGHKGAVNGLVFSPDGATLYAASGENALEGEVRAWRVSDGTLLRTISGHRDTVYALALSPDGKILATGSYDQQIKLWNSETGAEIKTLRGHNGAVFGLAFRPDGKILASASADRTIKLWDVATGQRRDTLVQPLKEQVAVAWSADGKRVAAGGFDNRIRVWEVSDDAKETTNPLLIARYAHEQPISRLAWSADGQTVVTSAQDGIIKFWDGAGIKERVAISKQPEWANAVAFAGDKLFAGRLDGSIEAYALSDGKPVAIPQPKVASIEPRSIERGAARDVRLLGENLNALTGVSASNPAVKVELVGVNDSKSARLRVTSPENFARGVVDISGTGPDGKSGGAVKLYIEDLPVADGATARKDGLKFPVSVWSTLAIAGASDRYEFDARAGQTLVFDLACKAIGAKTDAVLNLSDAQGRVLATNNSFDSTGDPLIAHTFKTEGHYAITVSDLQMTGSGEHFYRLSAGELPVVTACFPLAVAANTESEVELIGYHLPAERKLKVKSGPPGEMNVPLDMNQLRARGNTKLVVTELPVAIESEPNDRPAQATPLQAPFSAGGRIGAGGDADCFKFAATKGSVWVVETQAAKRGSPVDTKIEVLDAQGRKAERLLLQAVRDSAITFRPIDSITPDTRVDNWREMELNQWMYMNGEVAKIFRMPEGPDSGFQFYTIGGKRTAYFNTTATAHALDEPCYIVEPHPPGTKLTPNGLPTFKLYFENDDDGERKIGTDSSVLFTAPADGDYIVRVTDSRGLGGDRNVYQLVVREARPDFSVSLGGANRTVGALSGQEFTVVSDKKDGFDEPITVEISGVPEGYKVTSPPVIERGQDDARGTINALNSAQPMDEAVWANVKVTARSGSLVREVNNVGKVSLGKDPQVIVALEPAAPGDTLAKISPPTPMQDQDPAKPFEITIAPGEIIPAWIKIRRNGGNGAGGDIRFDVQNLPHGVIVDNLGLNGITLLARQNEGEIHIKAEPWVEEMDRLVFAKTRGFGEQTSLPVLLHVRKKATITRNVTVK